MNNMQEIIDKLKTKELTLEKIMSRDLFFLSLYYWKTKNNVALQACRNEAQKRLTDKGLKYINGEGWR